MPTDLEKQFFDTFGIEPYGKYYNCTLNLEGSCKPEKSCCICEYSEEVYFYPQITDKRYLELICVLTKSKAMLPIICSENTQDLKDEILWDLIKAYTQFKKEIKHQVQAIFEGER